MEPINWIIEHGEHIGVVTILLVLIYTLWDGKIIPLKAHKAQLDAKNGEIEALKKQLVELGEKNEAIEKEKDGLEKSNDEWKQLTMSYMQATARAAWAADPGSPQPIPALLLPERR